MQINRNQQILMEMVENYKKLKEVDSIGLGLSLIHISIADMTTSIASLVEFKFGANPPSSPTVVASPFPFKIIFRV